MIFGIISAAVAVADGADPITAILTRDWAAAGGWSLLVGTWVTIVVGAFREWWVPGSVHRRLEISSKKQSDSFTIAMQALLDQVKVNETAKHFFEETAPKRREADS